MGCTPLVYIVCQNHCNEVSVFNVLQHVAQFLIGLCEKSTTSDEFIRKLRATGAVEVTPRMVNFASELFAKVGHVLHVSSRWYIYLKMTFCYAVFSYTLMISRNTSCSPSLFVFIYDGAFVPYQKVYLNRTAVKYFYF